MVKVTNKPCMQICISMHLDDVETARKLIKGLKIQGFTNMNRSRLLRLALKQFDASKLTLEDNYK